MCRASPAGKRKLRLNKLPPTVLLFNERPNLDAVIRTIVSGIENGTGLPEGAIDASEKARKEANSFKETFKETGAMSTLERFNVCITLSRSPSTPVYRPHPSCDHAAVSRASNPTFAIS